MIRVVLPSYEALSKSSVRTILVILS